MKINNNFHSSLPTHRTYDVIEYSGKEASEIWDSTKVIQ